MSPTSDSNTFTVTIGSKTRTYYLWETSAPQAYDGFGTFTFSETGGKPNDEHYKRVVFVQVENAKWQEARYCSGLYAPVKREIDPLIKGYIEEQLFTRMEGGLS